ncbi:MAG: NUDIX domain-containing protein [Novosphingobium sp.]
MLYLIPKPVHIAALRTAHFVRLRWWRLTGKAVIGCRVLVLDHADRVLLIRHSYGSGRWMMPGGGLKRGEDVRLAAAREVAEEVALRPDPLYAVEYAEEGLYGARNHVHVLAGWTADQPVPDGREVIEARFFALDALPHDTVAHLAERLPGWITAAKAARQPPA